MDLSVKQQEFSAIFEAHADELFRHCHLRISDRERALELTQEAFLRGWDYIARGEELEKPRSFLYRILNNLIVDHYRKHKPTSLEEMIETDEGENEKEILIDPHDAWEDALTRFEGQEAVATLQKLGDSYRTVLTMRYIDGLSPSEIAHVLETSENTVSVRIHRGVKKLRSLLDHE